MRKHSRNHSIEAKTRARELRKNMGVSEKRLWGAIRRDQLGFRFRRQLAVGPYVLDFYCAEAALCVEVDGEQHDARRDEARDMYLASCNILVLRIPSLDLFEVNTMKYELWLKKIEETCRVRAEMRAGRRR